jgi:hypothetical protein
MRQVPCGRPCGTVYPAYESCRENTVAGVNGTGQLELRPSIGVQRTSDIPCRRLLKMTLSLAFRLHGGFPQKDAPSQPFATNTTILKSTVLEILRFRETIEAVLWASHLIKAGARLKAKLSTIIGM